jgi:hypothetical protein
VCGQPASSTADRSMILTGQLGNGYAEVRTLVTRAIFYRRREPRSRLRRWKGSPR